MADVRGQLYSCRIGGVEVGWLSSDKQRGQKGVLHTFAGSDKSYFEQTGLTPLTLTMRVMVGTAADFFATRDRLDAALSTKGNISITHPVYGDFRAKVQNFTESLSNDSTGYGEFSIDLVRDTSAANPQVSGVSQSIISSLTENSFDRVDSMVAGTYTSPLDRFGVQKALDKLTDIRDVVAGTTRSIGSFNTQINTIKQGIDSFGKAIPSLVKAPGNLASSVTGLLKNVDGLYTEPTQQLKAVTKLFNFGASEVLLRQGSLLNNIINVNTVVLNKAVNIAAFALAAKAASQINYNLDTEVASSKQLLEKQYNFLSDLKSIPGDLQKVLNDLRVKTLQYLNSLVVNSIIEVEIDRVMTGELISYKYYGDLSQADTIRKINNEIFLQGKIKIIQINNG